MKKRTLFLLIAFLFVLLGVASIYLFFRIKQNAPDYYDESLSNVGKTYIDSLPGDPIIKNISTNGRIVYDVQGYFVEEPKMQGKLFSGKLVIKDDELKREINTLIGTTYGQIVYGIYENSFDGLVTWKATSTEVVTKVIKPNVPVLVRVELEITEDRSRKEYVKEREEVMDTLIHEFQAGEFSYEIPADFVLVATGLAVIK
jgi:flagellar basal body-associated protein FliL